MPNQSGRTTSRDFAYQSTDQSFSHALGGADGASSSSTAYPHQTHDRDDAEPSTNASNAPSSSNQVSAQDAALRYAEFGAQQSSLPPQAPAPGQFPGYGFSPGGPLPWDWNNSIEFPDFSSHYEPQGELIQELQHQHQHVAANEFSIPLPVTNPDVIHQSPRPLQIATSTTNAQSLLSPPPKPPQRPALQTGTKRKAESEPNSAAFSEFQQGPVKRANKSRSSSLASIASPAVAAASDAGRSSLTQMTAAVSATESAAQPNSNTNNDVQRRKEPGKGTGPQGRVIDVSKPRRIIESPAGSDTLPAGKVFPIQIGSELFRLSGASISSDAPSYFSHFFGEQLHSYSGRAGDLKTLYIDRDPDTFRDIVLHLQGYHIIPRDGEHFVRLFADAQFYSLPRLTKRLFSTDIFIRIGGTPFQIPRDLFSSPGDSPNFFTLGFAQFFTSPTEVFPGLDRNALLRPPSISPPSVPSRSGEIFAELVKMLQGYNVEIRNEAHRAQLLRDARYFHLRGLEQKLIPCDVSFNLKRNQSEILIRLEDIRQSGVAFTPDRPAGDSTSGPASIAPSTGAASPGPGTSHPTSPAPSLNGSQTRAGTVSYARPYTDDHANTHILVLEISSTESTTLHFPAHPPTPSSSTTEPLFLNLRATFHSTTLARIASLFSVVAAKMGLPATQPLGLMMLASGGGVAAQPVSPANSGVSERRVRVRLASDCYMEMDSSPVELGIDAGSGRLGMKRVDSEHHRRKRAKRSDDAETWIWGGGKPDGASGSGSRDGEAEEQGEEWIVKQAHWRLRVEPVDSEGPGKMQVVLCGVRVEGFAVERSRNRARAFLGNTR